MRGFGCASNSEKTATETSDDRALGRLLAPVVCQRRDGVTAPVILRMAATNPTRGLADHRGCELPIRSVAHSNRSRVCGYYARDRPRFMQ